DLLDTLIDLLQNSIEDGYVTSDNVTQINKFIESPIINVYIDDLDRGWLGGKADIIRISALFNAIRDINNSNKKIQFRVSLRSDVYFLVRTSDESTDKLQSSVIWYRWSYRQILALLVKRVSTFFGK